jgi:hypothetical protein
VWQEKPRLLLTEYHNRNLAPIEILLIAHVFCLWSPTSRTRHFPLR